MALTKHGHGEILPEEIQKEATKSEWDAEDAAELAEENEEADAE